MNSGSHVGKALTSCPKLSPYERLQPALNELRRTGLNSWGAVTQQLNIINTMRGTKPVMMKLKLAFTANGSPVSQLTSVGGNVFPAGL